MKNVSRTALALALVIGGTASPLAAHQAPADRDQDRSDLSVLLVSHDPERPNPPFASRASERTLELFSERAPQWKALLDAHFSSVRLVHSADYEPEMSGEFDVTVFDAVPRTLKKAVRETNPDTGETNYEAAEYLPRSFSHPAITISDVSPRVGEPIGLKLDWL